MECFRKFLAVMLPSGDDINFEDPSWRLGEGSRLVVGVRLLFLDGRVLDSTGLIFWMAGFRIAQVTFRAAIPGHPSGEVF